MPGFLTVGGGSIGIKVYSDFSAVTNNLIWIHGRVWAGVSLQVFQGPGFVIRVVGILVRIDNSFTLETWAQGQDLNPDPESLQATGPGDQGAACLRFPGVKPLQAEAKNDGPNGEASQTKEIIEPNGGLHEFKSTLVTNQEPSLEEGMGLWPDPMTTTLEQDNQAAKLRSLTNEQTPGPGAILLPWNPSTQIPRARPSQCPDEPLMENVKFRSGVLYRPKNPALQTYCYFLIKVMLFWLTQLLPYFVFAIYEISTRSSGPPAPLPADSCPPGVPFGPVHFTEYPLKSEYKYYTPEKILKLDPLACIQSAVRYNCQGSWVFSTPKLFRGKFNYLPAYKLCMEPPVTPKLIPPPHLTCQLITLETVWDCVHHPHRDD
ncbi:hypothetical protein DSO57_1018671 [Entomophthora muscae]|uniref:Uncharacterized protein n=1 Tax=Entomophthora muscae TaxID=34485 RepID=A0ACC2U2K1_9FUNG|nr:hypothetical protein DSO57_1018671 [Entomophthora muscae]